MSKHSRADIEQAVRLFAVYGSVHGAATMKITPCVFRHLIHQARLLGMTVTKKPMAPKQPPKKQAPRTPEQVERRRLRIGCTKTCKRWTPEEIATAYEVLADGKGNVGPRLAKITGRTLEACHRKATSLAAMEPEAARLPWTDERLDRLAQAFRSGGLGAARAAFPGISVRTLESRYHGYGTARSVVHLERERALERAKARLVRGGNCDSAGLVDAILAVRRKKAA